MSFEYTIADLLNKLDQEFDPPLSTAINIDEYTKKIINNANILACLEEGKLAGFIAFYCNNYIDKIAYMSMLAVAEEKRGNGLAGSLINSSIEVLRKKGFVKFRLEVYKTNMNAFKLYERNNFTVIKKTDSSFIMEIEIN